MYHGIIFNVTSKPYLLRPLGGHRIAHYLRCEGWDIEVVDWANWWTLEQLQELFRSRYSKNTAFVGFSHLFSIWPEPMESLCRWIKENYPGVHIISGSAVNPMFDSSTIDYYIQGYGEHAITALLKYLVSNGPRPLFNLNISKGIKAISAIQSYPAYPMDNLMVRYEDRDYIMPDEWLTIEFSRGCMFSCAFCNFPVIGVKTDHTRSSDDAYNQLQDAHDRFGVKNYIVADETFNDQTNKISKFADVVERLNFESSFSGYIRADLLVARPRDREELLRMNFTGHYYGIESFNQKTATTIGKGMNSDRLKQGLIEVRQYFETHKKNLYRGTIGLIAGLPYETMESLTTTTNWVFDHWEGQSFTMFTLQIPAKNLINTPSKISMDYSKYGYRELTTEEIQKYNRDKKVVNTSAAKVVLCEEEVYWKNDNMDFFQAEEFTEKVLQQKFNRTFMPSCHGIGFQLSETMTAEERYKLKYEQIDKLYSKSIDSYINKKLSSSKVAERPNARDCKSL